eukprot:CAMPEP_0115476824 /NCGR_PEP_ID=MMETSP0271-20121206/55345_1 /TAXON_ID=71861 /ORGANISM="Scrippsiella trochoidea, Strain CCMP3099" /LENGTH=139 /DNA_ID=CAMNT_0002904267 /DNA_START=23 /DNA_END=443 /DNA_ORIENTATION=-
MAFALHGQRILPELNWRVALRISILVFFVGTIGLPSLVLAGVVRMPTALLMQVVVFSIFGTASLLSVYVTLTQEVTIKEPIPKRRAQIESSYPAFSIGEEGADPQTCAPTETCVVCLEEEGPGTLADACNAATPSTQSA